MQNDFENVPPVAYICIHNCPLKANIHLNIMIDIITKYTQTMEVVNHDENLWRNTEEIKEKLLSSLINTKDTKIKSNHNTEMRQIRSSATCGKYTLACSKSIDKE